MVLDDIPPPPIRIPNLPLGKMSDEEGMPTDDELTFRQALVTSLQSYLGNEGLVTPVQSPTNAAIILNHQNSQDQYTCLLGTILYVQHPTDFAQDKLVVAVRADNTYPVTPPVFKEFTLI